jgi:alpha-ketoglutarate-dependent taurine dioxygenase
MPTPLKFPRERKTVRADGTNLVSTQVFSPGKDLLRVVTPSVDGLRLTDWGAQNALLIDSWLLAHGGILFRGFKVAAAGEFQEILAAIAGDLLEYKERSSPRSQVLGNIYTSTDYPANRPILFHNENSYQRRWPLRIAFYCLTAPEQGGETPVADTRRVYHRLEPALRRRFEEQGVLYVRNYRGSMGYSWQEAFRTEDRKVVERYCDEAAMEYEWLSGGRLTTRARRPAVVAHPVSGEPLWFNHAAFFHSSSLDPAIRDSLLAEFGESGLPNQTYYGDGAKIDPADAESIRQAYRQESVMFSWRPGDVLLLDNMLASHAREPFAGARKILVGMARLHPPGD